MTCNNVTLTYCLHAATSELSQERPSVVMLQATSRTQARNASTWVCTTSG